MKKKKNYIIGIVPKANRKIAERSKIGSPNTQIHDCSLSWIRTSTSIKSGRVKSLRTIISVHFVLH